MATDRALLVLGPSTGGIRRHVVALADGLRARGWDVLVAGPPGVLGAHAHLDGVVAVPGGARLVALVRARAQLAALVELHRPTVVHVHGLKAGWVAAGIPGLRPSRAGRLGRPPVVVTVHNLVLPDLVGWGTGRVLGRLERELPRRVDDTIAVSAEVAARLEPVTPAGRLHVVAPVGPVPVATRTRSEQRALWGVPDEAPLVVVVARLHPQKGLTTLLDAVPAVLARLPGAQVVVVGEGPLRADLEARVASADLGGHVQLVGPMEVTANAFVAADVVAVASVWESGPLVAAEALELARPLVSTPVGFVPGLVTDGVSGRLVPVGDAPAMATALVAVLCDPAGAAAMGRAGRARVRTVLGADTLVARVEDVYRGMLSRS